jgi:hypothetical protein
MGTHTWYGDFVWVELDILYNLEAGGRQFESRGIHAAE